MGDASLHSEQTKQTRSATNIILTEAVVAMI